MSPLTLLLPKNLLRLFLGMAALALLLRLIGPALVSADRMEREIETRLAAWTGAGLRFSSTPSFTLWPNPQLRFDQARLRIPGSDGPDLLTVERVSVDVSPIGLLFGGSGFGGIELLRPTFLFHRDESGALNWRGGKGAAEKFGRQPEPDSPVNFGSIVIRGGTILVDDRKRHERYSFTNVEGKIDRSTIFSELDVSLQGIINGQAASWRLAANDSGKLLSGQTATIRTSFNSDPLAIEFDGAANLSQEAFAAGRVRIESSSLGHLLAWRGTNFFPARGLEDVALEGAVMVNGHTARLDEATLSVLGSNATGVLDISLPPQASPRIAGTLAFDRIDLKSTIKSFAPSVGHDGTTPPPAGTAEGIDLDLRISSKEASFEPLVLTDFAAGIRLVGGEASLDIGAGTLLGGSVSGRFAARGPEVKGGAELRLSLRDVDLGELIGLSGLGGPLPTGRGSAEIDLFTEMGQQEPETADLTGTFRLDFNHGAITNFDGPVFERLAQGKSAFKMEDAAGASFAFDSAAIEGHLDAGMAELTKATFDTPEKTLALSGTIPFQSRSVALAGSLVHRQQPDAAIVRPAINFLVGGSWPWPAISPIAMLLESPAN